MKLIRKYKNTFFGTACMSGCGMKTMCISPTAALGDNRRYILARMGIRPKSNKAMLKGKEMHEKRQSGIPTLTEFGSYNFKTKLFAGEEIALKEVGLCSPREGIRGYIDLLTIKKTEISYEIEITELKTGNDFKRYLTQLVAYGLVLSDPNCLVYEVQKYKRKDKTKNVPFKLYQNELPRNITFKLEIFGKLPKTFKFMENNQVDEKMLGYIFALKAKIKSKRRFHLPGIYYLEETDKCRWCNDTNANCNLWDKICHKIVYNPKAKESQKYYGRHHLLVASRPKFR